MNKILIAIILLLNFCVVKVAAQNELITITFNPNTVVGSNSTYGSNKTRPDSLKAGGVFINSSNCAFAIDTTNYRFYASCSTKISALYGTITRVEFNFEEKYNESFKINDYGSYNTTSDGKIGVWTGNVQCFTLKSNLCWVKEIKVSYIPFDIDFVGDGSRSKPFSVSDAIKYAANDNTLKDAYVHVKGIVSSVKPNSDDATSRNTRFYSIMNNIGDEDSVMVNGGLYLNNQNFVSNDQLIKGDQVIICGKLSSSQNSETSKSTELVKGNYIAQFWGNTITLDEQKEKNEIFEDLRHATVSLNRTFNANAWNSLVLPFDMTKKQVKSVFGDEVQLANYVGTTQNKDGTFTLNFKPDTTITANIPMFVYGAKVKNKTIEDVMVKKAPATFTPTEAAFAFIGSYDRMQVNANDWFISSDNKFYLAMGSETMKAMRAVFRPVKAGVAPQGMKSNLIERPTGVVSVNADGLHPKDVPIFNLAGQQVSDSYHGIAIIGGKKYVKP